SSGLIGLENSESVRKLALIIVELGQKHGRLRPRQRTLVPGGDLLKIALGEPRVPCRQGLLSLVQSTLRVGALDLRATEIEPVTCGRDHDDSGADSDGARVGLHPF